MALLYEADLNPTKLEVLAAWLPTRSWYRGTATPKLERVGSFRFDDPEGEVGIETILISADDGLLLHTPLTYRGAPLKGGEDWFVGNTHHSVLGQRWVYDACGDPVYASVLATAILTGGTQAEEFIETNGRPVRREPSISAIGSGARTDVPAVRAVLRVEDGDPSRIIADSVELMIRRVLGDATETGGDETIVATWSGQRTPMLLAYARMV